jgi:hypothetical protein
MSLFETAVLKWTNGRPSDAPIDYMRTRRGRRRCGEPPTHDHCTVISKPLLQTLQTAIDVPLNRSPNDTLFHNPRLVVEMPFVNEQVVAPVKRTIRAREKPVTPKGRRTVADDTAASSSTTNRRGSVTTPHFSVPSQRHRYTDASTQEAPRHSHADDSRPKPTQLTPVMSLVTRTLPKGTPTASYYQ